MVEGGGQTRTLGDVKLGSRRTLNTICQKAKEPPAIPKQQNLVEGERKECSARDICRATLSDAEREAPDSTSAAGASGDVQRGKTSGGVSPSFHDMKWKMPWRIRMRAPLVHLVASSKGGAMPLDCGGHDAT